MGRTGRILLSIALLAISAFVVIVVASEIPLAYALPDGEGGATREVAVFGPAVVATVVAGLAALVQAGLLVWNLVRPAPLAVWIVALVALLAGVVAAIVTATADRPVF